MTFTQREALLSQVGQRFTTDAHLMRLSRARELLHIQPYTTPAGRVIHPPNVLGPQ